MNVCFTSELNVKHIFPVVLMGCTQKQTYLLIHKQMILLMNHSNSRFTGFNQSDKSVSE